MLNSNLTLCPFCAHREPAFQDCLWVACVIHYSLLLNDCALRCVCLLDMYTLLFVSLCPGCSRTYWSSRWNWTNWTKSKITSAVWCAAFMTHKHKHVPVLQSLAFQYHIYIYFCLCHLQGIMGPPGAPGLPGPPGKPVSVQTEHVVQEASYSVHLSSLSGWTAA